MTREELINSPEYIYSAIECNMWPGKGPSKKDISRLTEQIETIFQERLQFKNERISALLHRLKDIILHPDGHHYREWIKNNQWQLHENGLYYKHATEDYINNDQVKPSARIKDSAELYDLFLSDVESITISL